MKKCPDSIVTDIHNYLDGDLDEEKEILLKSHLQECTVCYQHFHELEKAIALVQSTSHVTPSEDFTNKVMAALPKEKKTISVNRWLRAHPLLVAASIFIILMAGSLFGSYQGNNEFSFSKQPNLVVENETVIVPEGEIVQGDVVVRNGNIQIEGEVNGNVTVINGSVLDGENYLASAGNVTGEIREINEIFDWIWYQIKTIFTKAIAVVKE